MAGRKLKLGSGLIALRGVLLLIAGLFAILFPLAALGALVLVAGALFLVDGILGLWSITFGGAKTGNFWFDVVRNVLSILSGALILLSPVLATLITTTFVIYLIAFELLIVGGMEIYVVLKEREHYAKIWPVLLNGGLYALFGIMLMFAPLIAATVFMIMGGVMAIIFAINLLSMAWRFWRQGV